MRTFRGVDYMKPAVTTEPHYATVIVMHLLCLDLLGSQLQF